MPKKQPTRWMIACYPEVRTPGPEQPGAYFGPDGKPTYKSQAAEFPTRDAAKAFADRHGINVEGAMIYIVQK
jgi:hypothetical protein